MAVQKAQAIQAEMTKGRKCQQVSKAASQQPASKGNIRKKKKMKIKFRLASRAFASL